MDFLSWTSPPRPTQPLVSAVFATVPDISWHENNHTSLSTNLKNTIDSGELCQNNKYQYPQDLRLKFYQILQAHSHNSVITAGKKRSLIPTNLKQNPLGQCNDLIKQSHHSHDNQKEIFGDCSPLHTDSYINFSCACNYRNSNNDIKKLFILVDRQSQVIESLKLQIDSLLADLDQFRDNVTKMSSQRINNAIQSFESIKFQQTQKCGKEAKAISMSNKVSIGVMTSFEFTIQNVDVTVKNHTSSEEMCDAKKSHSQTLNALKGPMEKIIEKSEGQFSERRDRDIIDSYREVENRPINKVSYCVDNDVNGCATASAKVGWTFYNNVLCHVNEILHNSNEIQASHTPCDAVHKSNIQSVKTFGTVITDITNVIAANTNDKTMTVDSSCYPHVKYQNNVIHSSNSMTDNNASIHMRALASKYLGDKYCSWDHSSTIQKPTNELSKSSSILFDHMLDNTTSLSRNYMNDHELMSSESFTAVNSNDRKQNILDISILKRQPKLL